MGKKANCSKSEKALGLGIMKDILIFIPKSIYSVMFSFTLHLLLLTVGLELFDTKMYFTNSLYPYIMNWENISQCNKHLFINLPSTNKDKNPNPKLVYGNYYHYFKSN